jgi:hypothetical protein
LNAVLLLLICKSLLSKHCEHTAFLLLFPFHRSTALFHY